MTNCRCQQDFCVAAFMSTHTDPNEGIDESRWEHAEEWAADVADNGDLRWSE